MTSRIRAQRSDCNVSLLDRRLPLWVVPGAGGLAKVTGGGTVGYVG